MSNIISGKAFLEVSRDECDRYFGTDSMLKWLQKQIDILQSPELDWVQVETTSYCNASCIYCPHAILAGSWRSKHMSMETFLNLVPYLSYTNLVYLQGWGEPLMNPHLFEIISACKKHGKSVGFTSNGRLLTLENMEKLVDLQVDILGISFAGTTPDTHNRIRKGTDFVQLCSSLEALQIIKAEKKTSKPAVHLAYLMLADNFHEMSALAALAKRIDAAQIVASNLALILTAELAPLALFNSPLEADAGQKSLDTIKEDALRENIIFHHSRLGFEPSAPFCSENIYRACVVSAEGEVSPCVYVCPSLGGSAAPADPPATSRRYQGQAVPLKTHSFGNINTESLSRIWNKQAYVDFRRQHFHNDAQEPGLQISGLPETCRTCHKCLGL